MKPFPPNLRIPILIALLFVVSAMTGSAFGVIGASFPGLPPDLRRLDPPLRRLAENPAAAPPSNIRLRTDRDGTRWVSALLAVKAKGDLAPLREMGARIHSVGSVVSAELPVGQLPRLAAWQSLVYAEAARKAKPLLDRSAREIQADVARSVYKRNGRGILIGFVDSGIDLRHPAFLTPEGRTRIRYLWDQTDESPPMTGEVPFGREYAQSEIDDFLAGLTDLPQKDDDPAIGGHGTHVAGIAAGSGGSTPYEGIAPGADLLVVKWDGVHGLDANRYLAERAERLGRPVVINNSWGGHNGPHDGTDAESRGISALLGPETRGRAILFAAGNSGDDTIHMSGTLQKGEAGEIKLVAPNGQTEIEVEVWADAKASYRFGLRYPKNRSGTHHASVAVKSGESESWDVPPDEDQPYANAVFTLDARDRPYPLNPSIQRFALHLDLSETTSGTLPGLSCILTMERLDEAGEGTFDGWITLGDRIRFESVGKKMQGDARKTLVNQSCVPEGITVGAYVSRLEWTALNDVPVVEGPPGLEPGDPAPFSSQGPTRDGRPKPELIAPGQWVASALSGDLDLPRGAERYITPDGEHILLEGTSMASPHVAGTVALLLEDNPNLSAAQVKELLIRGAGETAEWAPKKGYGKLNAYESLRRAVLDRPLQPGDLNGDRRIDLIDAGRALQMALGLIDPLPEEIAVGDVAPSASGSPTLGDGRLSIGDVIRILRRSLHLEPDPWP